MELSDNTIANVKKQVEFYFSDSNLPFDKFLKEQVASSEDGWIDLSVVVAFSRMQKLLQIQCKSPDDIEDKHVAAVAAAVGQSNIVEVSEDGFQIRRKDMPQSWDDVIAAVDRRTIHAAPFPFNATLSDIGTFFSEWGTVNQVRMQRWPSKSFKGTVLVEMSSVEEAENVLQSGAEFKGASLRIQTKAAYSEALSQAQNASEDPSLVDVLRPVVTPEGLPEDPPGGQKDDEADEEEPAQEAEPELQFEVGCLVGFTLDAPDEHAPTGAALRSALGGEEKGIKFVQKDGGRVIVRCATAEHAKELLARGQGEHPFEVEGHVITLNLVDGDDETEFHRRAAAQSKKRKERDEHSRRGRGGYGRSRGRGRSAKRGRHR